MNTDDLIRQFADEGASKPLLNPKFQSMLWIVCISIYLLLLLFLGGFRPDISEKLLSTAFMLELSILFLIGSSATFAAFCLSRPDGFQVPWVKYVPFPLIIVWSLIAFSSAGSDIGFQYLWQSVNLDRYDCPLHILFFSTLPGIVIFVLIRMGVAIKYYWAGVMSTLSVTAFAYLFMRLVEGNDNPAHLIIWHIVPIILMCLLGIYAGRKALRWR
ncbi:MAG: hypothetical protein ACI9XC_000569 [Gammaproteobacteria bacterium]|jgi:hypothetical protein